MRGGNKWEKLFGITTLFKYREALLRDLSMHISAKMEIAIFVVC